MFCILIPALYFHSQSVGSMAKRVKASLDNMLYDDYLCLVASNKLQIQWTKIQRNSQEQLQQQTFLFS